LLKVGDHRIAGLMGRPKGAESMPPSWYGYIGVDDVDAGAQALVAAGGRLHRDPCDIPGVGRFAVVGDPQGASFMLFKGAGEAPEPLPYMTPGTIGWHELHAKDVEGAFAFYSGQFGWEKDHDMDMGAAGPYRILRAASPFPNAAMFTSNMTPQWVYYFSVPDIDVAHKAITANGGTVLNGPMEVPGGAWVVMARDPQDAVFAVVGMKQG
jgi:predicted enzyme related to lactoylglutathione lyase